MRILLATDFSDDAVTAYRAVKGFGLSADSAVRIVHAIEPVTTVELFAPASLLTMTEAAEAEARASVKAQEDELRATGVAADGVVAYGRAADAVLDECASFHPDLVVVGSRGRGAIATTVLGSVSAELVDRAPCPVLVARRPELETIVFAEDGTPASAAGARAVIGLKPFATARVRVVSVVDVALPVLFADPTGSAVSIAAVRAWEEALPSVREAHLQLARERAQAFEAEGIRATYERREGSVVAEIIAAAAESHADCVVVGSRGETGLRRLVLGSVARGVLFGAPCSVLIAHPTPVAKRAARDGDRVAARA